MGYSKIGFQKNKQARYTYTDTGIEKFLFDHKYYVTIGSRDSSATYQTDQGIYLSEDDLYDYLKEKKSNIISDFSLATTSQLSSYAKTSDLSSYAKTTQLNNLASNCNLTATIWKSTNKSCSATSAGTYNSLTTFSMYGTWCGSYGIVMGRFNQNPLEDYWYRIKGADLTYGKDASTRSTAVKIRSLVVTPNKSSTTGYPPRMIVYVTDGDYAYFANDYESNDNTTGVCITMYFSLS